MLLVDVLADQLRKLNRVRYRGEDLQYTEAAIAVGVRHESELAKQRCLDHLPE